MNNDQSNFLCVLVVSFSVTIISLSCTYFVQERNKEFIRNNMCQAISYGSVNPIWVKCDGSK